jgi:hypothetical protein
MMSKSAITFVAWFCVMGAALFVPAGTVDWRGGWIFLGEMVLLSGATVAWLAKYDPGLLKERGDVFAAALAEITFYSIRCGRNAPSKAQ